MSNLTGSFSVPRIIVDRTKDPVVSYVRAKESLLGKGAFGECHKFTNVDTREECAAKVLMIRRVRDWDDVRNEVNLQKQLEHPNIVHLYANQVFVDNDNLYIMLELCENKSLLDLQRARVKFCDTEVRFFLHQILKAVGYMHRNQIIHRDLKLENLFLDHELNVKVGDFGLATKVRANGELNRTLCGTPYYMAPEVFLDRGHSYEVDVWATGCILYSLLIGTTPFELGLKYDLKSRIVNSNFSLSEFDINGDAKKLIERILQPTPSNRPTVQEIVKDPFVCNGFLPHKLPLSALYSMPNFETDQCKLFGKSSSFRPEAPGGPPLQLHAVGEANESQSSLSFKSCQSPSIGLGAPGAQISSWSNQPASSLPYGKTTGTNHPSMTYKTCLTTLGEEEASEDYKSTHAPQAYGLFECVICDEVFGNKAEILDHQQRHIVMALENASLDCSSTQEFFKGIGLYHCSLCGESFALKGDKLKHTCNLCNDDE